MGGLECYLRLCSCVGLIGNVLAVGAFFFMFHLIVESAGEKNIDVFHLSFGNKMNSDGCFINIYFSGMSALLFFGCVDSIMIIYEFLLILNPARFSYGSNGFARGTFYVLCGFSVLGCASDLGIAAGIFTIISAALTFINTSLIKCDCMRLEKYRRFRKVVDNDQSV